MAGLSLEIVPGWVFTPGEPITTEKLNKLVNELVINLLGAVGSAQIGNGAVYTTNLHDGCLSADDLGRKKMADGFLLPNHVDASLSLGAAPTGFRNLKAVATGAGVTVTADEVTVRNAAGVARYTTGLNKTASLSAGTGDLGGPDGGAALANPGWVYVYVISNGTLFSTQLSASAAAPTQGLGTAAGYTYYALVGAFYRAGGAAWLAATQVGNRVFYAAEQNPGAKAGVTAWTVVSLSTLIPPTANVVLGNVGAISGASKPIALAQDSTGNLVQYFIGAGLASAWNGMTFQTPYRLPVLGSQQLYYKTNDTVAGSYRLTVSGYEY